MDNNYGTQQPNNGNSNFSNSDTNFVLGIAAILIGLASMLFTLCVPWLTWLIAAVGVACGIIGWRNQKKEGKPAPLQIIGTIISGISLLVATAIIIAFHITINKLEQNFNEMDSMLNKMRDSIQGWDTLSWPTEFQEPDSTFFIDNH